MKYKHTKPASYNTYDLRDRFLAGDESAYAELYKLYAKELYALGLWFEAKKELVEDAIQDVFVEIYSNRQHLEKVENLKLYFITAFRNRLFLLIKKASLKNLDIEDYIYKQQERDHLEVLIENEQETEQTFKLSYLLSQLNENQREALYHRYIEGLSCDEVAFIMKINYQSAKNLIHRAIKKLRSIDAFSTTLTKAIILLLISF